MRIHLQVELELIQTRLTSYEAIILDLTYRPSRSELSIKTTAKCLQNGNLVSLFYSPNTEEKLGTTIIITKWDWDHA